MSTFLEYSKKEFLRAKIYDNTIINNVLELINAFSNQVHSGSSAPYAIRFFKFLISDKTFSDDIIENTKKNLLKIGYKPIEECEDDTDKWIQENMFELIDIFKNQNHIDEEKEISYFVKLASYEPLSPIMNTDDEWNEISSNLLLKSYQNKYCSGVFKYNDEEPYYIDAIIFKNEKGYTYTGSALNSKKEEIYSRQKINLPFEPKSFVIDVIDVKIDKDNYESFIKDDSQLKEVWKFYERQDTPSYIRLKKLEKINNLI